MSAYSQTLRFSAAAGQLEPENANYLTLLGVAHYRIRNDAKALESLKRSEEINRTMNQASLPVDLAFLAMVHHRLEHAEEARGYLERLRERLKDPAGRKMPMRSVSYVRRKRC
jgi:hypothetical protein